MTNFSMRTRFLILIIIDSLIVCGSIFLGSFLLGSNFIPNTLNLLFIISIILLICHHFFALIFNLYHRAWEYASVNELLLLVKSITTSVIVTIIIFYFLTYEVPFLRLFFVTWMIYLLLIGSTRLSWRVCRKYIVRNTFEKKPTLVVGAGQAGSAVINHMLSNENLCMHPVLVVDDDKNKKKMTITNRIKVQGVIKDVPYLVKKYQIKKVVIAITKLSQKRLNEINDICNIEGIEVFQMPNIDEILSQELEVNKFKKIEVEDLLGRDAVNLDMELISKELTGKTILVTGAGGSIGSEICRQICKFKPKKIILLGHGENSIYLIHQELNQKYNGSINFVPIIADIKNKEQLTEIMDKYKPFIVYHAAAHKHVPLMEYNPIEAVENNIIGTKNTAEAAQSAKVENFVLISSDKAVNPVNVMGATKRIAEIVVQSLNDDISKTRFVTVRFGNVLESRGSVIPLFKKQIQAGGPVTITHPEMKRYFMTISEASKLVLQAGALAKGGEVFILDMGNPVKIIDLAKNLIKLSGKNENDIGIVYIGIRPGEKLREDLLNTNDIHLEQVHKKIYRGEVKKINPQQLHDILNDLSTNFSSIKLIKYSNMF